MAVGLPIWTPTHPPASVSLPLLPLGAAAWKLLSQATCWAGSAASLPAFPHPGNTVSLMPAHPMGCTKVENSHLSSLQICVPHAVPALVSWRALSGAPWLPDAAHHVMSTLTPHSPGAPSESRGSCLLPQPTQACSDRVLVPAGSLLLVASSCPAGINSDMASSLEPPPAPRSSLWIISWDF